MMVMNEKVHEELAILKDLRGVGGPTHPLEWMCDTTQFSFDLGQLKQQLISSPVTNPAILNCEFDLKRLTTNCEEYVESLFPILRGFFESKLKPLLTSSGIDVSKPTKFAKGTMYLIYLPDEMRNQLSVDEVLCLYLIDAAENTIVNFYKLMTCFV